MTPTNTEALAALSYAEAAKLLANELDYKYQRGIDPHDGEWREAVTLLHRLSAVEAERDALLADAERWRRLYRRAINEANGLTNYVDDRPELRRAERQLEAIQREAGAIDAAMKGTT